MPERSQRMGGVGIDDRRNGLLLGLRRQSLAELFQDQHGHFGRELGGGAHAPCELRHLGIGDLQRCGVVGDDRKARLTQHLVAQRPTLLVRQAVHLGKDGHRFIAASRRGEKPLDQCVELRCIEEARLARHRGQHFRGIGELHE